VSEPLATETFVALRMLGLGVKVRPASLRLLRVRQWSLALTTPAVPLCLAALRSLEGEMRAAAQRHPGCRLV
jgi:hypothetical protein